MNRKLPPIALFCHRLGSRAHAERIFAKMRGRRPDIGSREKAKEIEIEYYEEITILQKRIGLSFYICPLKIAILQICPQNVYITHISMSVYLSIPLVNSPPLESYHNNVTQQRRLYANINTRRIYTR